MPNLDLRTDTANFKAMLGEAVSAYVTRHSVPGGEICFPTVTRVDFVYTLACAEVPLIDLHFDSRLGGEPDGTWTHPRVASTECPHWNPARFAAEDGKRVTIQ